MKRGFGVFVAIFNTALASLFVVEDDCKLGERRRRRVRCSQFTAIFAPLGHLASGRSGPYPKRSRSIQALSKTMVRVGNYVREWECG